MNLSSRETDEVAESGQLATLAIGAFAFAARPFAAG